KAIRVGGWTKPRTSISSAARCSCARSRFFFRAEDGIRAYKVTGVQPCALPIYPQGRRHNGRIVSRVGGPADSRIAREGRWNIERSEERRVGKERSTPAPGRERNKNQDDPLRHADRLGRLAVAVITPRRWQRTAV